MREVQRVKATAQDLKLSLEALGTVGKPRLKDRPLTEALEKWRGEPLEVSPALKALLARKDDEA